MMTDAGGLPVYYFYILSPLILNSEEVVEKVGSHFHVDFR